MANSDKKAKQSGVPSNRNSGRYRLGTLDKALTIIEKLDSADRPQRIQELVAATGIERGTVFRVLHTLEKRGYAERLADKTYRSKFARRRTRLGYSAPMAITPFRRDVAAGILRAANKHNLDLLILDNTEDNAKANVENVNLFLEAGVDLVMEFQPIETIAHVLADRFSSAGIPVISIEAPIPGTIFFGANNYKAGKMVGEVLGRFAAGPWKGEFDKVLLIESSLMTLASQARLTGALDGMQDILGPLEPERILHLDGHTHLQTSRAAVMDILQGLPPKSRLLISAFNDPSAIGALQAVRELKRERHVAIVGQNGTAEAREELRNARSPLIASVAYFPEQFGEKLIPLALSILKGEKVPLAVYTDHVVLDRENVDRYYPADKAQS